MIDLGIRPSCARLVIGAVVCAGTMAWVARASAGGDSMSSVSLRPAATILRGLPAHAVQGGPADRGPLAAQGAPASTPQAEPPLPPRPPGSMGAPPRPTNDGGVPPRPADIGGLSSRPADVGGGAGRPADVGGDQGRPADTSVNEAQPEPADDAAASGDDPWGFAGEEEETWADILRQQALDLSLLAGFLTIAMVSFFKKSVPLKLVTFVLAVGYMGFVKSQLLSVVNVFGILDWNWPIFKYNLSFYLLFGFTVTTTVLWGRVYCGRICAFGAFTQLMDKFVPPGWRVDVPASIEKRAALIKYGILVGVVAYFWATHDMSVYRYVEPFWMFGLSESAVMWVGLAVLLAATIFVRNLYCRFLCPLGATLGLLSFLTVFKIKRWSECKTCRICEKACEYGAIQGPKILVTECVRCDDCERLYTNDDKCPHWLIPKRKAAKAKAAQARPTPA